MRSTQLIAVAAVLAASTLTASKPLNVQHLLAAASKHAGAPHVLKTLADTPDVVEAFRLLHPEQAAELDEPRLLQILGDGEARWATEGDKLRLRREGVKFMDLTGHVALVEGFTAYKAQEPREGRVEQG